MEEVAGSHWETKIIRTFLLKGMAFSRFKALETLAIEIAYSLRNVDYNMGVTRYLIDELLLGVNRNKPVNAGARRLVGEMEEALLVD